MPQRHLIKKYANRKLYDTTTSHYVTLEAISELVRAGHEIEVVDRVSGRDLTPLILSQIVMTEEKRGEARTWPDLLDYMRRGLHVPALVTSEVGRRRSDLESVIEIALDKALQRLSIPTRGDIQKLERRLNDLSAKLDRMQAGTTASRTRKGPAV